MALCFLSIRPVEDWGKLLGGTAAVPIWTQDRRLRASATALHLSRE
jgi:hypothetical protein